jgi:alpha-tubulin suppressor-like RCC1 family protein
MAVTGAITTGFRDENGVDLGRQLVEKDYLISVYPNLIPNMKAPGLFAWGTGTSGQFGNNTASFASSPVQVLIGSSVWKQVSGGYNHAAAIAIDGTLWAWGLGTSGQLGNGIAGHRSSPIQTISFGTNWSVVSNSGNHVSSTKSDGTLWTWGLGTSGQLGDGTIVTKSSPVQAIVYAENWGSVVATADGRNHAAAIKTDGTLWTWGRNSYGQLGDNTIIHRSSPIQTIALGTTWSSVTCGYYYTAAIKTDGTLWLWGRNNVGQLGNNTLTHQSSPVQVVGFATTWSKVSGGIEHTAAIKTDGTLWSWGSGGFGSLGDNTATNRSSPIQTITGGTTWSQVSAGNEFTFAIKTDGTLWSWGKNDYGQLGNNTITNRSSPIQTVTLGTTWISVAAGFYNTAAIKTDGTIWTWGDNSTGALGDNTIIHRSSPVQVVGFATTWSSVAGQRRTVAIKKDGTLWSWGSNNRGELGDNTIISKSSPVQVVGFATTWSSVACGYYSTKAIKKDGTMWTWGSNSYGALGNNDTVHRSSPVQPLAYAFSTNWSNTSAGAAHTSAIKKDGTLWSWGLGTSGQLGNNTATSTSLPVQEMTYSTIWSQLSAGSDYAAAIKTDSTLWLWGLGTSGQLGDNTATSKSSPVQTVSVGGPVWISVDGGVFNTAAIKSDGTLWAWGSNSSGQLGDGTITYRSSPVQTVVFGVNWSSVACGREHTAAIKTDGTLWTWGLNNSGQLGDNTLTNKSSPVQTIARGTNWNFVSCGNYHTAAIKTDGTLWTWGSNGYTNGYYGIFSFGQLGDNTQSNKSSPVQTIAGGTNWSKVSCGSEHTAAIKTDGTLWVWGFNPFGQLGDNTTTAKSSPIQTIAGGNNWSSISCGFSYTAAIKTDGTLWAWGSNSSGRLGDNTITNRSSPVQTITGGTNWSSVGGGRFDTAAIKTDGTLWTWGRNTNGQLGDNTITDKSSPVQTIAGGTNWNFVSCGNYHTAAIKTDGTLWNWGLNSFGRLGDNTIIDRSSPVQTIGALGGAWQSISCGFYHTTAIKTDGTLWLWGLGTSGQLGDNTAASKSSPIQTITFGTTWSKASAGYRHTGAIKTDGTAWTWGLGTSGQLGDGTIATKSSPVQVVVYANNWNSVGNGYNNTAAIKKDGTLWMMGSNANGMLGDNTTVHRSSPIQTVAFGTNWSSVTCGYFHTAAVKTDGTLWTWGRNSYGVLGDNTFTHRSSPVQTVAFGTNWGSVACGSAHSAGVKTDGTLWTWGLNTNGQLGDNTITSKSSPVQVIGFANTWSIVACGRFATAATKKDGTLWTWGGNTNGALGDNTTTHRSSPVQVIGFATNWSSISLFSYGQHMAAIKTDGTLWTWGLNSPYGQLGDNTTGNRSSPVQTIAFGTNWSKVASGYNTITALKSDGTFWLWGRNTNGQLGDNTTTNRSSPVQTVLIDTSWSSIGQKVSTKTDGTLWGWGLNNSGQLGNNTAVTTVAYPLQPLAYSFATNWSNIACGTSNTVATKTDGTLWTWGISTNGSLGNNLVVNYSVPIQTIAYGTNWSQTNFSNFGNTVAAMRTDNTLWTFGTNTNGQLIVDLAVTNFSSPVQILPGTTWLQFSAGKFHSAFVKSDNTLWSSGDNTYGQLGINTSGAGPYVYPTQEISASTSWKQTACGDNHTMTVKTDGTLWGWGYNAYGQLGDNTATTKSSPVQTFGSANTWKQVACGSNHTVAAKIDGTVWTWGKGTQGQLGTNTITHRSSPIQTITYGSNWFKVAAGYNNTTALFNYNVTL